ncbi:MAG: AraC family transcriptional regulator [Clostridium sp.]|nr:AraC family transcriptional regulator [Clostridium sp.]
MEIPEKDYYRNYRETKEHAARDFPFNIYPCSIPVDFKQVPVHWHEELEVIAVKKGYGIVTVDMEPCQVEEGEAVMVFPGQLHGICLWKGDTMEYENIIFRPSMLMTAEADVCTAGYLMPVFEGRLKRPLHIKKELEGYGEMMECIGCLDRLSGEKGYGYQLGVKGALFRLMYLAAGAGVLASDEKPSKSREKMKRLLDYIETHYGEPIGVEEGAALCYYSNSHFMKYFKQYMGVPFIQYLNDFRLEKAGGFLLETQDSVTSIAQRCGFDNLSYFNRMFRRKYSLSPGEYRKEMGET